jgi:hypothetical protein
MGRNGCTTTSRSADINLRSFSAGDENVNQRPSGENPALIVRWAFTPNGRRPEPTASKAKPPESFLSESRIKRPSRDVSLGNPNTNLTNAVFGRITSASDPRILQLCCATRFETRRHSVGCSAVWEFLRERADFAAFVHS